MTEFLNAIAAIVPALKSLFDLVMKHDAEIVALKAQVQAHDAQLKTAPEPGPIVKGN